MHAHVVFICTRTFCQETKTGLHQHNRDTAGQTIRKTRGTKHKLWFLPKLTNYYKPLQLLQTCKFLLKPETLAQHQQRSEKFLNKKSPPLSVHLQHKRFVFM